MGRENWVAPVGMTGGLRGGGKESLASEGGRYNGNEDGEAPWAGLKPSAYKIKNENAGLPDTKRRDPHKPGAPLWPG